MRKNIECHIFYNLKYQFYINRKVKELEKENQNLKSTFNSTIQTFKEDIINKSNMTKSKSGFNLAKSSTKNFKL